MKHNNPALCALRRLHADIGGKIIDNRKRAKRLHEDRRYVAAVIRMFSPDYDVKAIPARRRYKVNAWFKRGTLFRFALDVMKGADEPLTVREIVDRMLATKGVANARVEQVRGLQRAVLASLRHRRGKGRVQTVGEGIPDRWTLTP
jgi:hypothetical protein